MTDAAAADPTIEELVARVSELEHILFRDAPKMQAKLGLTPAEGRIFAVLLENGYVSRNAAQTAMGGTRAVPNPQSSTLGVVVHRMRSKLERRGIIIRTLWNDGYALAEPAAARAIVEAL